MAARSIRLRAVISDGFTKANVQLLAAALARKMKGEGAAQRGFLMGCNRRFLSRETARWAAEVMAGAGVPRMVVERGRRFSQEKLARRDAQIKALQARINPRFLFHVFVPRKKLLT